MKSSITISVSVSIGVSKTTERPCHRSHLKHAGALFLFDTVHDIDTVDASSIGTSFSLSTPLPRSSRPSEEKNMAQAGSALQESDTDPKRQALPTLFALTEHEREAEVQLEPCDGMGVHDANTRCGTR